MRASCVEIRTASPILSSSGISIGFPPTQLADSSKHHLLIKPRHTAKIAEKGFKVTTIRM
jgi:hypothetical protein